MRDGGDARASTDWREKTLPDIVRPGLDVVFIGINPGKRSAEIGHHFGGANNHFWPLLFESGWTPRLLSPEEDAAVLAFGIGLTNLAPRATRGAADLGREEMVAGGALLKEKLSGWAPKIACFLGKAPYAYYSGQAPSKVAWGLQPVSQIAGIVEFVAPNPSGRSAIPYKNRLRAFQDVRAALDAVREGSSES